MEVFVTGECPKWTEKCQITRENEVLAINRSQFEAGVPQRQHLFNCLQA
jgi:hypothetical protein